MSQSYTIRYRCTVQPGQLALVVEDQDGASYLFAGGRLRTRLSPRLNALAEFSRDWLAVTDSTSYSLAGLRQLVPTPILPGLPGTHPPGLATSDSPLHGAA